MGRQPTLGEWPGMVCMCVVGARGLRGVRTGNHQTFGGGTKEEMVVYEGQVSISALIFKSGYYRKRELH